MDDDGVIIKTAEELAEEQAAQEQQSGDASSDSEDGDAASQEPSASPTPGPGQRYPRHTPLQGRAPLPRRMPAVKAAANPARRRAAPALRKRAPGVPSGAPYYRRERRAQVGRLVQKNRLKNWMFATYFISTYNLHLFVFDNLLEVC